MSLVLEEDFDTNFEPTDDEILEYAKFLGIDPINETHLLWIAQDALKAPLPTNWKPCQDADSNIYYFNFTTGESRWEHPCDDDFRKVYAEEKKKLALGSSGSREVLSETKFDPFSIKKSDSLPKLETLSSKLPTKLDPLPSISNSIKTLNPIISKKSLPEPPKGTFLGTNDIFAKPPISAKKPVSQAEYDDDFDVSSPELELSDDDDEVEKEKSLEESMSEGEEEDNVRGARRSIDTLKNPIKQSTFQAKTRNSIESIRRAPSIEQMLSTGIKASISNDGIRAIMKKAPSKENIKTISVLKKEFSKESMGSLSGSMTLTKNVTFCPSVGDDAPPKPDAPLRTKSKDDFDTQKKSEKSSHEKSIEILKQTYAEELKTAKHEHELSFENQILDMKRSYREKQGVAEEDAKKEFEVHRKDFDKQKEKWEIELENLEDRIIQKRREFRDNGAGDKKLGFSNITNGTSSNRLTVDYLDREKKVIKDEVKSMKSQVENKKRELDDINREIESSWKKRDILQSSAKLASESHFKKSMQSLQNIKSESNEDIKRERNQHDEKMTAARKQWIKEYEIAEKQHEEMLAALRDDFEVRQQQWSNKTFLLAESATKRAQNQTEAEVAADEHEIERLKARKDFMIKQRKDLETEIAETYKNLESRETDERKRRALLIKDKEELDGMERDMIERKGKMAEERIQLSRMENEIDSAKTRLELQKSLSKQLHSFSADKTEKRATEHEPVDLQDTANQIKEHQDQNVDLQKINESYKQRLAQLLEPGQKSLSGLFSVEETTLSGRFSVLSSTSETQDNVLSRTLSRLERDVKKAVGNNAKQLENENNYSENDDEDEGSMDEDVDKRKLWSPTTQLQKQMKREEKHIKQAKSFLESQKKSVHLRQQQLEQARDQWKSEMDGFTSSLQTTEHLETEVKYLDDIKTRIDDETSKIQREKAALDATEKKIGQTSAELEARAQDVTQGDRHKVRFSTLEEVEVELSNLSRLVHRNLNAPNYLNNDSRRARSPTKFTPSIARLRSPTRQLYTYTSQEYTSKVASSSTQPSFHSRMSYEKGHAKTENALNEHMGWLRNFMEKQSTI